MKYIDEAELHMIVQDKSWDNIKDKIFCRVMNAKCIDKYNKDIVYDNILDLAITYSVMEKTKEGMQSHMLTQADVEKMNVDVNEIKKTAKKNTSSKRTRRIWTLKEFTTQDNPLFPLSKMPDKSVMQLSVNNQQHPEMMPMRQNNFVFDIDIETGVANILMIGDRTGVFGAAYMTSSDMLDEVYNRFNKSNFYVIPFSIHCLMCVRGDYASSNGEKPSYAVEDDLLSMLEKYNDTAKTWKDILSYKIYYYYGDDGNKLVMIK